MAYDVEHLSMCLFVICTSSWVRCLFRSFCYFLTGCLSSYCGVRQVLCAFRITALLRCVFAHLVCGWSPHSLEVFSQSRCPASQLLFSFITTAVSSLTPRCSKPSSMLFPTYFVVSCLHLGLWYVWSSFLKGVKVCTQTTFSVWMSSFLLLNKLSFLRCVALALSSNISWVDLWGSISGLSLLFHWSVCLVFSLIPTMCRLSL